MMNLSGLPFNHTPVRIRAALSRRRDKAGGSTGKSRKIGLACWAHGNFRYRYDTRDHALGKGGGEPGLYVFGSHTRVQHGKRCQGHVMTTAAHANCGGAYARATTQSRLDLADFHAVTGHADLAVSPAQEFQMPGLIAAPQVTGTVCTHSLATVREAESEESGRLLRRRVQVTAANLGARDQQFADDTVWHLAHRVVYYPHRTAGKR
jgi:hypothetical protein